MLLKIPVMTTHERKCGRNTAICVALEKPLFCASVIITASTTGSGNKMTILRTEIMRVLAMYFKISGSLKIFWKCFTVQSAARNA